MQDPWQCFEELWSTMLFSHFTMGFYNRFNTLRWFPNSYLHDDAFNPDRTRPFHMYMFGGSPPPPPPPTHTHRSIFVVGGRIIAKFCTIFQKSNDVIRWWCHYDETLVILLKIHKIPYYEWSNHSEVCTEVAVKRLFHIRNKIKIYLLTLLIMTTSS